jgi:hypothetical protein
MDAKRNFLEVALSTGLETKIITPDDVCRHIEPEVLASHLPVEAKTALLSASLKAGKMSPNLVFDVIEPRVFAEHMPEHMLWACIAEAADKVLEGGSLSSQLSSSLLGDKSARPPVPPIATRRPSPPPTSRRPARLAQQQPPPRPKVTKPGVEFEIEAEIGDNWTKQEPLGGEEHFSDWVEETVTGADALTRRKR